MNRTPDVELVLREYLADDGFSAPDHLLEVVAQRIGRQPQRRRWRLLGRPFMNSYAKLAAAAAAVFSTPTVPAPVSDCSRPVRPSLTGFFPATADFPPAVFFGAAFPVTASSDAGEARVTCSADELSGCSRADRALFAEGFFFAAVSTAFFFPGAMAQRCVASARAAR